MSARCVHVVFGAGRCDRPALMGAVYCALHRGYIADDPLRISAMIVCTKCKGSGTLPDGRDCDRCIEHVGVDPDSFASCCVVEKECEHAG